VRMCRRTGMRKVVGYGAPGRRAARWCAARVREAAVGGRNCRLDIRAPASAGFLLTNMEAAQAAMSRERRQGSASSSGRHGTEE